MAEVTTAGNKAWSMIMGTVENKSEGALFRFILILVLIASAAFGGYTIFQHRIYIPPMTITPVEQQPVEDINRLNKMIENLNASNAARLRSMEVAEANEVIARYPFYSEKTTDEDALVDIGIITAQPVIVPPGIIMRASLLIEGKSMAVIDIEGEQAGKIYRVGDRFADAKGRITRITRDNVTVIYEGKEFVFVP